MYTRQQRRQRQQHEMIKFFPSNSTSISTCSRSVATHNSQSAARARGKHSGESFDCFHTQININVLFCGRNSLSSASGSFSLLLSLSAPFPFQSPTSIPTRSWIYVVVAFVLLLALLVVCGKIGLWVIEKHKNPMTSSIHERCWETAGAQISCRCH